MKYFFGILLFIATAALAQTTTMAFETELGTVTVTPLGHASLLIELKRGLVIHVDPWSRAADYSQQPDADWIWVTHEHGDHLDLAAINEIATDSTRFLMDGRTAEAAGLDNVTVLANGESLELDGMRVLAVPAYNVERERDNGQKYHPEGWYNGFILEIGSFRVHIAGDTECVPEFAELGELTVSFLPINLPFTMPPEEAADCYRTINPRLAIPYHQGDSDPQIVADLLADTDIQVMVLELP